MLTGQKKKKNQPNTRRRTLIAVSLIGLFLVIGAVIAIGAMMWISNDLFADSMLELSGDDARPRIEESLKTTLPDSATDLHYYYTSWLDFILHIRFDLPADDVPAFLDGLDQLCFELPLQDNLNPIVVSKDKMSWWTPGNAEQFSGLEQCGNDPHWHLMIDQSQDDVWIVYIEVFST